MSSRRTGTSPNVLGALGGFVWLAVIILPIYYTVITSLREQAGFFAANPLAVPDSVTFQSYAMVIKNGFGRYFMNSVVVTGISVLGALVLSLMAAYAIVRSSRRLVKGVFTLFLLGLAIPLQATIVPLYYMITRLGLYDSLLALILPSVAFALPISVLILVNFLRDIPASLFESMRVDGASEWRMLWSLALPLSKPAVITVGIYNGLHIWNGFLLPLVLTQSEGVRVIPLSLWAFQGEFSINVPAILAAVVLSALPVLAAYLVGRRQLVSGLTAGFGK